jgi:hypothetical protein
LTKCGTSDLADELAEWVESADDFSMVLWMAFTVEGAGQAPEISRISYEL